LSYEIDRIRKEFKYAAFYMYNDFGISSFLYNGKRYEMSARYLLGRLRDDNKNIIPILKEHEDKLKTIYYERIIPMFGEYNEQGNKIKDGAIDFIVEATNPTGVRNYIINKAIENGEFIKEKFNMREDGQLVTKERIVGYKPNDPNEFVIIVLDHLRKLKSEKGYDMKQRIDKMGEYETELRNWCGYTFVNILHLNRNLDAVDQMKYSGEYLYPTNSSFKDSGNFSEESDVVLTMMNPNDDKYKLSRHFDLDISHNAYPNYRSLHLIESRDTECPVHLRVNMFGAINVFSPLNIIN
jgi:hypothetical protein